MIQSRRLLIQIPLLVLMLLLASIAPAINFDRLLDSLVQQFGKQSAQSFRDWKKMIENTGNLDTKEKLKRVNEFVNRRIQFVDDQTIWGQSDYWATPMQTIGKGAGDCEDIAILKYYSLLNLSVPDNQLRLIYVKASIGGQGSSVTQAHMVLAYYPTPDAEPLVLDNLITEIRPASRRPDIKPIFSFNSQGVYQGPSAGNAPGAGGVGSLSRWQDLLKRASAEGFE